MSAIKWTGAELKEFDRLVDRTGSRDQLLRLEARLDLSAFVKLHTKAKCDAMWVHLMAKEAKK